MNSRPRLIVLFKIPLVFILTSCEHWYELSSRIDAQKTALNVKADLDNYVKPLFNTYKSLDDLVRFTEIYEGNKLLKSPYEYIAFLMLTNQKDKGELMIRNYYRKALALKGAR